jgi:TPR repeat protein
VQSEPRGAEILLDGKAPQKLPNTFTHLPFGPHQLSATLKDFEPLSQTLEVRRGMNPEIHLQFKPIQEIAALTVQSEPPGAEILLDGKAPQKLPNTFTHVPFGTHQLSATSKDFEPLSQPLEVSRGMSPEIRLQLKPIQEMAALTVQSEPPGAQIFLDGTPPKKPPNTFTHVPFGTHQLSADLNDFEPLSQSIEVRRGMAPEIRLQLKPSQEIAALTVESEPRGAAILLDGKVPEKPPNTFTHVPFGTHQLSASLNDFEPLSQSIEVHRGMASEIRLKLNQKPNPMEALLTEAKRYEEGSPQQLTAYVRLVQSSTASGAPDAGEHTKELGRIIERLRTKVPPVSKDEFNLYYEDGVRDAANLNLLPAILWLAENEKESEALSLFLRAAKLGDSYAMMKLGRLYLRKGTATDDAEGLSWLKRAYDAPNHNLEAGAYIGDCYLSGKGTKQDIQKAEGIIMPLANQKVVPAMTLAGRILQYKADLKRAQAGESTSLQIQKKLEAQADELDLQARGWWERAEKEDWNASAHLGKCYEEGWGGLEKNAEEAEKRYQEGANHGNPLSMFFYGLLLEKKPDRHAEAKKLISQAATAGLPSAIKWCRENDVIFTETRTDDDRQ